MVCEAFKISQQQLSQYLTQNLGCALSAAELSTCYQEMSLLEPSAGKCFWRSTEETGLYIVLAGKVRLVDCADNLITSINSGKSFGESTIFSEASFSPYVARAAMNLKLCHLPNQCVQNLMLRQPRIRSYLYQQAVSQEKLRTENGQ